MTTGSDKQAIESVCGTTTDSTKVNEHEVTSVKDANNEAVLITATAASNRTNKSLVDNSFQTAPSNEPSISCTVEHVTNDSITSEVIKTMVKEDVGKESMPIKMSNRFDQVLNRIENKLIEMKQMLSSASSPITCGPAAGNSMSSVPPLNDKPVKNKRKPSSDSVSSCESDRKSLELSTPMSLIGNAPNQPLVSVLRKSVATNSALPTKRVMFADGIRPGESRDDYRSATITWRGRKKRSIVYSGKSKAALGASFAFVPFFGFNTINPKNHLQLPQLQPHHHHHHHHSSSAHSKLQQIESYKLNQSILMHNQTICRLAASSRSNDSNKLDDVNEMMLRKKRATAILKPTNGWPMPEWNQTWIPYTVDEEAHLLYTSRINQTFILGWLIKNV